MAAMDRVAHRLKLRDLRLFDAVVQWKSMAKAASHLNLTQPAVSKAISELEHTLGVRLLDRNRQGIEPTAHGKALLKRGVRIFDEVRQGMSEIEHLSDPNAGEVRVAASSPIAAGILPVIIGKLSRDFPRISIHAREVLIGSLQFHYPPHRELREREVDLAFGPIGRVSPEDDFEIEHLFDDTLVVAAGKRSRWLRRRAIRLQDLMDEPWCLPAPDSVAGRRCVDAFAMQGMKVPKRKVTASSVHLQLGLLTGEQHLTMFPGSLMRFGSDRLSIQALPIKLGVPALPVGIVTLKDRTIGPAAKIFMQSTRDVAKLLAKGR